MTTFGVSLARVGRSEAGKRIEAAGKAFEASLRPKPVLVPVPPPEEPAGLVAPENEEELFLSRCRIIIRQVAGKWGMSWRDLCGPDRRPRTSKARAEAMYRCTNETHLSLVMIAKAFNRDHSTVIYACQRYAHLSKVPLPRKMSAGQYERRKEYFRSRRRKNKRSRNPGTDPGDVG